MPWPWNPLMGRRVVVATTNTLTSREDVEQSSYYFRFAFPSGRQLIGAHPVTKRWMITFDMNDLIHFAACVSKELDKDYIREQRGTPAFDRPQKTLHRIMDVMTDIDPLRGWVVLLHHTTRSLVPLHGYNDDDEEEEEEEDDYEEEYEAPPPRRGKGGLRGAIMGATRATRGGGRGPGARGSRARGTPRGGRSGQHWHGFVEEEVEEEEEDLAGFGNLSLEDEEEEEEAEPYRPVRGTRARSGSSRGRTRGSTGRGGRARRARGDW